MRVLPSFQKTSSATISFRAQILYITMQWQVSSLLYGQLIWILVIYFDMILVYFIMILYIMILHIMILYIMIYIMILLFSKMYHYMIHFWKHSYSFNSTFSFKRNLTTNSHLINTRGIFNWKDFGWNMKYKPQLCIKRSVWASKQRGSPGQNGTFCPGFLEYRLGSKFPKWLENPNWKQFKKLVG